VTRHLLVIGAQRCGTTYLHGLLAAHPRIAMARPARPEPKVFLSDDLAGRGLRWYRATYFAHASDEDLLGEKSTSYLEHPDAAPRAASVLGAAHIVVMLRDPVERAVSNWQFSTANGYEDRPLREALLDNLRRGREWDDTATSVSPYAYLERGRYADYLDPWFESFPATMHTLFFETVVGNGDAVEKLYAALGVDPAFRPGNLHEPVNQSERTAPRLPLEDALRLRAYFAASDAALAERLRCDLPWRPRRP
jgi:hypothetical protein